MTSIGVVFGGPSPEHDISILTGLQAARALQEAGRDVRCLYWEKSGTWRQVPVEAEAGDFLEPSVADSTEVELTVPGGFVERRRLRSAPIELKTVLNCCHGGPGEDGSLTSLLRLAGLRTTGPDPQAAALLMDKYATAAVARAAGIPTIETVLAPGETGPDESAPAGTGLPDTPWVVKPRFGGSSIGVEAGVEDLETVAALGRSGMGRSGMLIQPFLEGWMDLNISVRTHPGIELSEIERPLKEGASDGVYSYKDKYLTGGAGMDAAPRELPAQIPAEIASRIMDYTRSLVEPMGLSGAPRVDYLWDGHDEIVLCELNAVPGAWGNHLWQASGVDRTQLYGDLLDEALRYKPQLPQWAGSSDGHALRMSGSIAAKLS